MAVRRYEHFSSLVFMTTAERTRKIHEQRLLIYDTDLGQLYVGDMATVGGLRCAALLVDANGNEEIEFGATTSAVNHVKITNAATGTAPKIESAGGDTNVDLKIGAKGTGAVALAGPLAGSAEDTLPFTFRAVTVTPASDADVTLTAAQYACPIVNIATGSWTGPHNVIVPNTGGPWIIVNGSGQTATVKTAAGTGISVATGKVQLVYADGVNVIAITDPTT
jgi:hypothetical protein